MSKKKTKAQAKKKVTLFTPVVRLDDPRNDTWRARLISMKAYIKHVGKADFPCANPHCEDCENAHNERVKALNESMPEFEDLLLQLVSEKREDIPDL